MNKRNRRNRSIIIILSGLILFFATFSILSNRKPTSIESVFSDSVSVIEYYLIKKPINFITGIIKEYTTLKDVYEENKKLKEKLDKYASVEANIDALSKEISELKKQLNINYLPSEYKIKTASVITRDISTWDNIITIDQGSSNGVKVGMAVVDSKGMIGVVKSVTQVTATVELLTSNSLTNGIPIYVLNGNETLYGILEGYDSESSTLQITMLSSVSKLEANAKVYTSGLGGKDKAPSNIYIGMAKKLKKKKDGTTTVLTVKAAGSFNTLRYVSVVQKLNEK